MPAAGSGTAAPQLPSVGGLTGRGGSPVAVCVAHRRPALAATCRLYAHTVAVGPVGEPAFRRFAQPSVVGRHCAVGLQSAGTVRRRLPAIGRSRSLHRAGTYLFLAPFPAAALFPLVAPCRARVPGVRARLEGISPCGLAVRHGFAERASRHRALGGLLFPPAQSLRLGGQLRRRSRGLPATVRGPVFLCPALWPRACRVSALHAGCGPRAHGQPERAGHVARSQCGGICPHLHPAVHGSGRAVRLPAAGSRNAATAQAAVARTHSVRGGRPVLRSHPPPSEPPGATGGRLPPAAHQPAPLSGVSRRVILLLAPTARQCAAAARAVGKSVVQAAPPI